MSWLIFKYVPLSCDLMASFLPFNIGSFTNSLFLVMLKREEFWRLSFFTCGGPENFILLIEVAGGCVSVLGQVPFFFAYLKINALLGIVFCTTQVIYMSESSLNILKSNLTTCSMPSNINIFKFKWSIVYR